MSRELTPKEIQRAINLFHLVMEEEDGEFYNEAIPLTEQIVRDYATLFERFNERTEQIFEAYCKFNSLDFDSINYFGSVDVYINVLADDGRGYYTTTTTHNMPIKHLYSPNLILQMQAEKAEKERQEKEEKARQEKVEKERREIEKELKDKKEYERLKQKYEKI